jgi:hypothetical protein
MAITQMTRFKSDKTAEMVKNAKQAKAIFEKHVGADLGCFLTGESRRALRRRLSRAGCRLSRPVPPLRERKHPLR